LAPGLPRRRWTAGLDATCTQGFHEVAPIQAVLDRFRPIALAAKVQPVYALVQHLRGKRDGVGDDEIPLGAAAHDLIVRGLVAYRHLERFEAGVRMGWLATSVTRTPVRSLAHNWILRIRTGSACA
jgi:hypothetical protein